MSTFLVIHFEEEGKKERDGRRRGVEEGSLQEKQRAAGMSTFLVDHSR